MAQRSTWPQLSQAQGPDSGGTCPLERLSCLLAGSLTLSLWALHTPGCQQVRGRCWAAQLWSCLSAQTQAQAPPKLPEELSLPGTYITQDFLSGDPKLPTSSPPSCTCLQALVTVPASLQSQSQLARGQARENSRTSTRYLEWGRVEGKSFPSLP